MNIIASIPIKPHLKQFALLLENCEEDGILNLTKGGIICYVLRMMLIGKMNMPDRNSYRLNAEYCDELKFYLSSSLIDRGEVTISAQNVVVFNQFLHKLLNELLLDRVLTAKRKYREKEIETIYDFLRQFHVDELLTYDAVKKSNYRLRKVKKLPIFTERGGGGPEAA